MGFDVSGPRAKSAKTAIESGTFAAGQFRYGVPEPPPRSFDWRTPVNAPAKRAKHSNSVPLFGPACALRPRHGPLCAVFLLCPGVRRCRRSFCGVGRSQAPARFFWCRPLHRQSPKFSGDRSNPGLARICWPENLGECTDRFFRSVVCAYEFRTQSRALPRTAANVEDELAQSGQAGALVQVVGVLAFDVAHAPRQTALDCGALARL
jgi:hypothetical protein